MSEYGISVQARYSPVTDQQLDTIVSGIQHEFPVCRYWQMLGHLHAKGLIVQQSRARESQRRVDPGGCVLRRLCAINRRMYSVNGPLALWHMDGSHKLIRYIVPVDCFMQHYVMASCMFPLLVVYCSFTDGALLFMVALMTTVAL